MKTVILLLLTASVALSEVSQEERDFIKREQEKLRKTLQAGIVKLDPAGEIVVPPEVFRRELEIILGPHAGKRPYPSSAMGEKFKRLAEREKQEGLTYIIQSQWTDLFWEWRAVLEGDGGR